MKKSLSTLLIGTMLWMPVPVLATEEDDVIHSLSFNKIEEKMKERSPLILNANDSIWEASSDLSKAEDGLEEALNLLNTQKTTFMNEIATLSDKIANPATSESDKAVYNSLLGVYQYLLGDLTMNIQTTENQIENIDEQQGDMWKSYLKVEQGEKQAIYGAQQIFLGYFNLAKTRDDLQNNLTLLQQKLKVLQLKESLGLVTHLEGVGVENQIKELSMTIDTLNQGLEAMIGQLNVMLGQDFDTELSLSEPSVVSQKDLRTMDYEEDLEDALDESYTVRLEEDSDKREDAERNFTLAFHQAYQNVQDKKKALELEQTKLNYEQIKFDQSTLMNSLGLLSNLDYEGARALYNAQVNKVKTAQLDLLQAYTAYDWMKKGLTVSTGASAGASAGASGASASSAASSSGAASSGMGF